MTPLESLLTRAREAARPDYGPQQKLRRIEYLLSKRRYAAVFEEGLVRWMQQCVQGKLPPEGGNHHGSAA